MLIVLPDWVTELEDKLDKVIKDLAVKKHIDITRIDDSQTIKNAKESISNVLVDLYWHYKVDERKRLEEFEESMKKENVNKVKRRKVKMKTSGKIKRAKTTSRRIRRK